MKMKMVGETVEKSVVVRQILTDMMRPADIYSYYPNRRQPNHKFCRNLYYRLGGTGSFPPKSNHGTPKTITVDEDGILIRVSENPGLSARRLSKTTGLS
ncbi:hypothetical protein NQ318_002916 [Aromia moschata]|uniref:Uncharacterized protein n=1 Tax=Aromia moschata TaxID=1265417 RepID=A0AAV8Y5D3_9CUCU|nr:hypothetical protein NQ318_002916 [Aromia moschata]